MKHHELHTLRHFSFQPKEKVNVSVSKGKNAQTRLAAITGAKPVRRRPGELELTMPGTFKSTELNLDVRFVRKPEKLHTDVEPVRVTIQGSSGSVYRHRISPGPQNSRWTFRLLPAVKGKKLAVCVAPRCPANGAVVEVKSGTKRCPKCKNQSLLQFSVPATIKTKR